MTPTDAAPVSLDLLDAALSALDPKGALREVSYNLVSNNTLPEQWWVFMPYGKWPIPSQPPTPSPLQGVISEAVKDASQTSQGRCYIDVLHLSDQGSGETGTARFFTPIIQDIVNFIKSAPSGVTPVIRYVVGEGGENDSQPKQPSESGFMQELYAAGGFGAHVFYGNFAPSFALGSKSAGLPADAFIDALQSSIAEALPDGYAAEVERLFAGLPGWETLSQLIAPMSWNHAKIFALNGSQLVTGGANYWSEYSQGETWLFDLSMRIGGDAAIAAHKYANYLWAYLSEIPETDTCSRSFGNYTSDLSKFEEVNKAPALGDFPTNSGATRALAVGRIGNWLSPTGYPVQVIDGLRDFVVNVIAALADKHGDYGATAAAVNALADENLRDLLLGVGVNPAAWASRSARNCAIWHAQSHVRLSQQALVMDDLMQGSSGYRKLVEEINDVLGTEWDGIVWPYDTLSALGNALATFSQSPNVPGKVQIVCSTPTKDTGYEDPITAEDFRERLSTVMAGMSSMGYIEPNGSIPEIVKTRVEYLKVDTTPDGPPVKANHAKLVVVDDVLCYIGSDNLYPGYNEEFGIWIEDQQAIQAFVAEYWTELWSFASQVKGE